MNFPAGARQSRARGKSPGWAAFDLKQRSGAPMPRTEDEPFPLISGAPASSSLPLNNRSRISGKPFSLVLLPSDGFPRLANERTRGGNTHTGRHSQRPESSGSIYGGNIAVEMEKLKELHSWADEDLIRDIYEALGCSFSKTTSLLEGMAIEQSVEAEKDKQKKMSKNHYARIASSDGQVADEASSLGIYVNPGNQDETDVSFGVRTCEQDPKHDTRDTKGSTAGCTASLRVEPKWEEEDAYLRSRRNALHAMRSASRHSRAASNAFLRGDHSAAQHHSSKAREQWVVAEKLNNDAAKEILLLRNHKNDIRTLDLHGLHKTEALQALSERLQKIELQCPSNRSISPNQESRVQQTSVIPRSSSSECLLAHKLDMPLTSRPRSSTLQVITGVGKHSKEQAALPAVVKSFLSENGYHYDEVRPGVVTVWPKFRSR
ncbi:hypothetical protein MLD38_003242 [Melastoma candidum]|uniref:Uncharacterized protein n=1 Tax=Melastoma candidum TaxID=119954 RepID=A0ACB9S6H2_9MYRT|nr:hypothetical protein MLD38_003242 [Melastoma candidum]